MSHNNGPTTVSNMMPASLMSGSNNHVLTPVPGDPSGRLVMTLLPQGHGDPISSHSSHSNHSTQYATTGLCLINLFASRLTFLSVALLCPINDLMAA